MASGGETRDSGRQPGSGGPWTALPVVAYVCLGIPAVLTGLLIAAVAPQALSTGDPLLLFFLLALVAVFAFWVGMINPKVVPGAKGSRGRVIVLCGGMAVIAVVGFSLCLAAGPRNWATDQLPAATITEYIRPTVSPAH